MLDSDPRTQGSEVSVGGKEEQQQQLQGQGSPDVSSLSSQQPIEASIVVSNVTDNGSDTQNTKSATPTNSPLPSSRATAVLFRQVSSPTSSMGSGWGDRGDFASFASSSPIMHRARAGDGGRLLVRQPSSMIDTTGFSEDALEEINKSMHPFKDIHSNSFFNERNRWVILSQVDI